MSEWNFDMDAAPKDGTELIGFRPDQGVFSFRWATMEEIAPAHDESFDDFECWWHDRWGWMEGDLTPTAWQHLPPPPQVRHARCWSSRNRTALQRKDVIRRGRLTDVEVPR